MHDVLVAGGGPAGLAVALGAARAGLDVVICEKRSGTVDKACGEGLMPGALRDLLALGVDPPGHDIQGITYRQGAAVATAPFRDRPGRGVRRTTLHDTLRESVLALGVPIHERPVADVEQHRGHVTSAGLEARYLVAADGLHSSVRTAVGLSAANAARPRRRRTARPRWGQRRHYALAPATDMVEVTWAATSEAYVTPIADDTIGVAILSSTRGAFADQLDAFPELAERLRGATPVSDVRGAGPLRQRATARVAGRVLLVGDAAGYIDALTGEGLALSLAAAAELVQCLVRDRPADYDRAWSRISRRSRWLTSGLLWARSTPGVAHRVVPLAARAPRLFASAVHQLAQ